MQCITIGFTQYFYRLRQNLPSPALILLHGSGGDSSVWDEQFKGMSFNGTLIAPDLPGHGQSAGFPLQSSSDYALWLDSLVNELQPENLFIAGHSLGGTIAQEFARRFPETVQGLILIGCGSHFTIAPDYLETIKNDFLAAVHASCRSAFAQANTSVFYERGVALLRGTGSETLYNDIVACRGFDSRPWISSLSIPSLILCGSEDRITRPDLSEELARLLLHAELKIIPGSGHMAMMEAPGIFNSTVKDFIEKHRTVSGQRSTISK